jgi:predicted transcriptional regulator
MKTAVSVPDEMFDDAERLAKRLKISRSELYQRALGEFVARHADDSVTEALDRVCDTIATESDAFVAKAARRTLKRVEW